MKAAEINILSVIGKDTVLKRVASTGGGEFAGACPFCGGRDRFRVWQASTRTKDGRGRFWCRQCGRKGDAFDYLMQRDGVGFAEAKRRLGIADGGVSLLRRTRPDTASGRDAERWRNRAAEFVEACEQFLWSEGGAGALKYLRDRRGFGDASIRDARLGLNDFDRRDAPERWGLTGNKLWLPRGVVIPYFDGATVRRVQIRRFEGEPRYLTVSGSENVLWNKHRIDGRLPVVLTEGVLDALSIQQAAGGFCVVCAAGSAMGARLLRWRLWLKVPPVCLIAFDNDPDGAGDDGAQYWLEHLPNARRLRPTQKDANDMLLRGEDVRAWVRAGIEAARFQSFADCAG